MRQATRERGRLFSRLVRVLVLLVIVSLVAGGCALVGKRGVSAVDDAGREISLERAPRRIVSMAPSNTEILFALGLGERVVGVTSWCNYPPETAGVEKVGDWWAPDYEKIVALEPDLVLAVGTAESELVKRLEGLGLKVFILQAETVLQVPEDIEQVAAITGVPEKGAEVASDLRRRIEAVQGRVGVVTEGERPTVFWVLDADLWTVGPGSFVHDLIVLAGGVNIAGTLGQASGQLSLETVLEADPDVIIIPLLDPSLPEALGRLSGWGTLRAVRDGRVYQIDPDVVSRPGPRIADALEEVAKLLYPSGSDD